MYLQNLTYLPLDTDNKRTMVLKSFSEINSCFLNPDLCGEEDVPAIIRSSHYEIYILCEENNFQIPYSLTCIERKNNSVLVHDLISFYRACDEKQKYLQLGYETEELANSPRIINKTLEEIVRLFSNFDIYYNLPNDRLLNDLLVHNEFEFTESTQVEFEEGIIRGNLFVRYKN